MTALRVFFARLLGMLRRRDAELDEDIQAHLDLLFVEDTRRGMSPDEARLAARRSFGGVTQTKEAHQAQRQFRLPDEFAQDVRYALRGLRRSPGFACAAVLTLASGIAAATIVFTVAYNVLIAPVPYRDFARSVVFSIQSVTNVGGWRGRAFFPPAEFIGIREDNRVLEDLIGYQIRTVYHQDERSTRLYRGANVTANTLEYLGVRPLFGRSFVAADGDRGAPAVFAMNHRLWQTEFGGDLNVLGRTFVLDDTPKALVAIMPPGFEAFSADIWVATAIEDFGVLMPVGRLRRGVTLAAAAADLDAITHRYAEHSKDLTPAQFRVVVRPFLDSLIGDFRQTLYGLLGAVLLLVMIAATNVAGLLLTRTIARERELALRASLGATRGRLIRQSSVEILVLAAAASLTGWLLAYVGLRVVDALMPAGMIPPETGLEMNGAVLVLSIGVTAVTTIVCGIGPALYLARTNLAPRLASGSKGVPAVRHTRLRRGLVVAQVALAAVLLVAAVALMRGFLALTQVDLGFSPSNIVYVRPWFPRQYDNAEKKNVFTRELLRRMEAVPGVVSVAESMLVPPLTHDWSDTIIPGKPHAERWETRIEICSEGYFETIGLRLVRGSLFTEPDVATRRLVTVVNETFVRRYFPDEEPLGRTVKFQVLDRPFLEVPRDAYFEIIGVVSDHLTWGGEWQTFPQAYFPYSVQGFSFRTFLARTTIDPDLMLKTLRDMIWALDPSVGISATGTIERSLREFYRDPQFDLVLLTSFATIGLVLVTVGVFALMAYTVTTQTREIGVRLAIGARPAQIFTNVLGVGSRLVAAGVAVGLPAAYLFSGALLSSSSAPSRDFPTLAAVAAIIVAIGLVACYLPARRATRVDPMVALRCE